MLFEQDPACGRERFMLYRLSYLWYCVIGSLVTIIVGLIVSYFTTPNNPQDVDPQLLTPLVRKFIQPRKFPNEPTDRIIFAYKSDKDSQEVNAISITKLQEDGHP